MEARRWWALLIAGVLGIMAILFGIISVDRTEDLEALFGKQKEPYSEVVSEKGNTGEKIAVVRLEGTIMDSDSTLMPGYNHQEFLGQLDHIIKSKSVQGVVLYVNSPGGGVVESAEIHDKIEEIVESGKKVYTSMGNTAASGGYYVSAPTNKIVAHPATLTGSIGVIVQSLNVTKLAEDLGVEMNTFTSGKHKDILSATREMTSEEEDIMQSIVDDMYEDFVDVVKNGRDMPEKTVKKLADGRVYTGKQAVENKLIDELGTLEDTIDLLAKDEGLANPQIVEYKKNTNAMNELLAPYMSNMINKDNEMLSVLETITGSDGPRAMYLYSK